MKSRRQVKQKANSKLNWINLRRRRKLPRFDDDLSKKKSHIFELFDSKSDLQPIFSISSKNQMFDHHDCRWFSFYRFITHHLIIDEMRIWNVQNSNSSMMMIFFTKNLFYDHQYLTIMILIVIDWLLFECSFSIWTTTTKKRKILIRIQKIIFAGFFTLFRQVPMC